MSEEGKGRERVHLLQLEYKHAHSEMNTYTAMYIIIFKIQYTHYVHIYTLYMTFTIP